MEKYPTGSFVELAILKKEALKVAATPIVRPPIDVSFADGDFQTVSVANVRAWPAANAQKVARLEPGARVWAIGETKVNGTSWYRIARDGVQLGFVYGPLVTEVTSPNAPSELTPVLETPERGDAQDAQEAEPKEAEPRTVVDIFSSALDELLERTVDQRSADLPAGLPEGSKFIGEITVGGWPIWEAPDGSQYEVTESPQKK